jgi:hypothetical protein
MITNRAAEVAAVFASVMVAAGVVLVFLVPQATAIISGLIGIGVVLGIIVYLFDPHALESGVTRVCMVIVVIGVIITVIYVLHVVYVH